jgi:hypothetical protein
MSDRKSAHHKKDSAAAGQFADQRKERNAVRGKQVWVWDVPPQPATEIPNYKNSGKTAHVAAHPGIGHWERSE